ncbi:hypothetical protein J2Y45_006784 [Dyadobacter sp. BE34]|nr:hypothetical protein [Dyadobacter sp. BE34]MDR7219490.1 hypothetical protein [Dyadobacter sp. BE31]MDR7267257.1 hypothetical protein [Dyadobacter sp. BE32]
MAKELQILKPTAKSNISKKRTVSYQSMKMKKGQVHLVPTPFHTSILVLG